MSESLVSTVTRFAALCTGTFILTAIQRRGFESIFQRNIQGESHPLTAGMSRKNGEPSLLTSYQTENQEPAPSVNNTNPGNAIVDSKNSDDDSLTIDEGNLDTPIANVAEFDTSSVPEHSASKVDIHLSQKFDLRESSVAPNEMAGIERNLDDIHVENASIGQGECDGTTNVNNDNAIHIVVQQADKFHENTPIITVDPAEISQAAPNEDVRRSSPQDISKFGVEKDAHTTAKPVSSIPDPVRSDNASLIVTEAMSNTAQIQKVEGSIPNEVPVKSTTAGRATADSTSALSSSATFLRSVTKSYTLDDSTESDDKASGNEIYESTSGQLLDSLANTFRINDSLHKVDDRSVAETPCRSSTNELLDSLTKPIGKHRTYVSSKGVDQSSYESSEKIASGNESKNDCGCNVDGKSDILDDITKNSDSSINQNGNDGSQGNTREEQHEGVATIKQGRPQEDNLKISEQSRRNNQDTVNRESDLQTNKMMAQSPLNDKCSSEILEVSDNNKAESPQLMLDECKPKTNEKAAMNQDRAGNGQVPREVKEQSIGPKVPPEIVVTTEIHAADNNRRGTPKSSDRKHLDLVEVYMAERSGEESEGMSSDSSYSSNCSVCETRTKKKILQKKRSYSSSSSGSTSTSTSSSSSSDSSVSEDEIVSTTALYQETKPCAEKPQGSAVRFLLSKSSGIDKTQLPQSPWPGRKLSDPLETKTSKLISVSTTLKLRQGGKATEGGASSSGSAARTSTVKTVKPKANGPYIVHFVPHNNSKSPQIATLAIRISYQSAAAITSLEANGVLGNLNIFVSKCEGIGSATDAPRIFVKFSISRRSNKSAVYRGKLGNGTNTSENIVSWDQDLLIKNVSVAVLKTGILKASIMRRETIGEKCLGSCEAELDKQQRFGPDDRDVVSTAEWLTVRRKVVDCTLCIY